MKRLIVMLLVVVLTIVGMSGCGMSLSDDRESWSPTDGFSWPGGGGGPESFADPEIEARAELY